MRTVLAGDSQSAGCAGLPVLLLRVCWCWAAVGVGLRCCAAQAKAAVEQPWRGCRQRSRGAEGRISRSDGLLGTVVAWWCGHVAGGISPRRRGKGEIRLLGFCRGLSETGEVLAGVWEGGDGQQGEVAAQGGEGCRGLGVSSDPMEEVSRSSGGGLRKPGGGAAAVRLGDGGRVN